MSGELTTILINTGAILLALALWGGSIVYITWDTSRRNVSGCRQLFWLLLAFIPLVGFAAYLIARPLMLPEPPAATQGRSSKWVTIVKPAAQGVAKRAPTIAAAEYLRAGQPDPQNLASPAQQRWAEARQSYLLATVEGPHTGQNFVIDHLPACIGRGFGCAISLDNDGGVSRRHAELYQHAGKLRIRDLNSTHGTKVNNYNISDKGLLPGDRIRVGYSLLIVKMER